MNKQQIFDTVVAALIRQGKPSFEEWGCAYRGQEGSKCAIGHLIPDDKYEPTLEGASPLDPDVQAAAGIRSGQSVFACELQKAHDYPASDGLTGADWLAAFKERARAVAIEHNLKTAVLDE